MQTSATLLDVGLERAAEAVGDITAPAMARFYAVHPEARAVFEHHGVGRRERLEAEMVQNALYWAMTWLDCAMAIRVDLGSSVPHHEETLKVPSSWYRDLVEAVIATIAEAIPADRLEELELWDQIRRGLGAAIEESRSTLASPLCATALQ